ncbi:MAG: hypothetical protein ACOC2E_05890 [Bacteroidota bacterium]
MNSIRFIIIYTLIFFFSYLGEEKIFSQPSWGDREKLKEQAYDSFQSADYKHAATGFVQLISLFPKDPFYHYFAGVSMVKANLDMNKAEEYLRFAMISDVPDDVYFYLGLSLHKQYRYDEALEYLNRFDMLGEKKTIRELELSRYFEIVQHASILSNNPVRPVVFKKGFLQSDEINSFTQKREFYTENETGAIRRQEEKDNPIVFFAKENSKSGGLDIYMKKRNKDNNYSPAEVLSSPINTPYDENYPFFDPLENKLYFASKGHNSMGGYDIFVSTYNPASNTFSTPQNLGFPINTPYNDFFLMTGKTNQNGWFFSDRESEKEKELAWYHVNPSTINNASSTRQKGSLYEIAQLNPNARLPVSKINKSDENIAGKDKKEGKSSSPASPEEKTAGTENNYINLLNEALQFQLKADSLSRVSQHLRNEIRQATTEDTKRNIYREILDIESRAENFQKKANVKYATAREIELTQLREKSRYKPIEQAKKQKQVHVREIEPGSSLELGNESQTPEEKDSEMIINEFKIRGGSIYSKQNPFAEGEIRTNGIMYRIQLGVFSKPIPYNAFRGLTPVTFEKIESKSLTKYYAGDFNRIKNAERALEMVKQYGFREAFIVSWFNGKKISLIRAREIESLL